MSKNIITRKITLTKQVAADKVEQYRATIPKDFIDLLNWKGSDKLKATLIVGSGMVCFEKDTEK